MSFYDNIISFVTDRSKRISARATIVILVIAIALLTDNISGFSYYYNKQRQINQLKSISELLRDPMLSAETKNKLLILEQQTLERKNIINYSYSFLRKISWPNSQKNQPTLSSDNTSARNEFWFFVSSSGVYVLILIITVPIILFTDKKTPILRLAATLMIFSLIIAFTAWFNYWLFGIIIPDRLFGSWMWNYLVNFSLQVGLGAGLYWANRYKIAT